MKKQIYGVYVLLVVWLIAAACFLPQLVFQIQDYYRMENTWSEARQSMNIDNLNIPYEISVGKRLQNFAESQDTFFVTGTDCEINVDSYSMVDEILYEDMVILLSDWNVLPGYYFGGYDITKLKKYVFYREELDSGVALIAWYCSLRFSNGAQLEFLSDEKTNTIYHMKYYEGEKGEDDNSLLRVKDYYKDNTAANVYANAIELTYYFGEYYESNFTEELYMEQKESEWDSAVSNENGSSITNTKENSLIVYNSDFVDVEKMNYEILLPYQDVSLNFSFAAEETGSTFPDVTFGIKQIAELIPEFSGGDSGSE